MSLRVPGSGGERRSEAADRDLGLTQTLEELIDSAVLSAGQGFQVLLGSDLKQTW